MNTSTNAAGTSQNVWVFVSGMYEPVSTPSHLVWEDPHPAPLPLARPVTVRKPETAEEKKKREWEQLKQLYADLIWYEEHRQELVKVKRGQTQEAHSTPEW